DLRRLERHRPHAARRLRCRALAAEPVRPGGSRALRFHRAQGIPGPRGEAMTVSVLRPGLLTTVQDAGRHGFQHLGVVPGGAMDPVALARANALVGNEPGAAALEITILRPELGFAEETLVAL